MVGKGGRGREEGVYGGLVLISDNQSEISEVGNYIIQSGNYRSAYSAVYGIKNVITLIIISSQTMLL